MNYINKATSILKRATSLHKKGNLTGAYAGYYEVISTLVYGRLGELGSTMGHPVLDTAFEELTRKFKVKIKSATPKDIHSFAYTDIMADKNNPVTLEQVRKISTVSENMLKEFKNIK